MNLPQDGVVGPVESNHLEGEGLRHVVGRIPKSDGQVDLPERCFLFPGMTPWKDAAVDRISDRSTPMVSRVLVYMMLKPLPLPISTVVRHFVLTIRSTTSGHLLGCGMLPG
jgi:hypothetical protein